MSLKPQLMYRDEVMKGITVQKSVWNWVGWGTKWWGWGGDGTRGDRDRTCRVEWRWG